MAMIDFYLQRIKNHRANLGRYSRLLATQLTDTEREYIHRRIAEEHSTLIKLEAEHLAQSVRAADPDTMVAARVMTSKSDPHIG
jgi:hypothetical protein